MKSIYHSAACSSCQSKNCTHEEEKTKEKVEESVQKISERGFPHGCWKCSNYFTESATARSVDTRDLFNQLVRSAPVYKKKVCLSHFLKVYSFSSWKIRKWEVFSSGKIAWWILVYL